jgi:GrpB-like predicted nucleotidyltransferase (UPF0157 family)
MDEIEIVACDPRWPSLYQIERDRLLNALSRRLVLAIEHFGSTAIPGLAAKPIIDILIAVQTLETARQVAITPLEALGYAYWPDNPATDRMFFVKGLPPRGPRRTHHVHITEITGEMWHRLLFRDYLRANSDEMRRYEALKRQLARAHPTDREAYTASKNSYVAEIMRRAERSTPN